MNTQNEKKIKKKILNKADKIVYKVFTVTAFNRMHISLILPKNAI